MNSEKNKIEFQSNFYGHSKQRFLHSEESILMCEPVIYNNKDRVLVLTQYRILLYSPDEILAQEEDLKGTEVNLGDRKVKVDLQHLVALSVWPIRTFKEK